MSGRGALLGRPMRWWRIGAVACCLAVAVAATVGLRSEPRTQADAPVAPPPNFKVAFIGDQGITPQAEAVMQLILDEGADMVLHLGDFGYDNELDPQTAIDWDAQVTAVMGADFPYFGAVGNHDVATWSTYQQLLEDRLALVPGASCTGDYGAEAACTYQGLFFVLSGIGMLPGIPKNDPDHLNYLAGELAGAKSIWKICAWHANQSAMQVGSKPDEIGWGAYELCREEGAILATAHEHSYHRTKTLIDMTSQATTPLWPDADEVLVGNGNAFAFVSGIGGHSKRHQKRCLPTTPPYGCNGEWANIYTNSQGANYGALFIEFHVDGDPYKASGYFKDIDGNVPDAFTIYAAPPMLAHPGDTDGDGCSDAQEAGANAALGGQRDYMNPWDFYDVAGSNGGPPDGVIDLFSDVLGVIQRYSPIGNESSYDAQYDRSPAFGPNSWNMGPPDGTIDLFTDILGVIHQHGHDCR